jgi:YfiH family protein
MMFMNGSRERSGVFRWTQEPWGAWLSCAPLAEVARHGFTSRALRLRASHNRPDDWALVAGSLGVSPRRLIRVRQVHGTSVLSLERGVGPLPDGPFTAADAITTNDPDQAIAVQVADCVPILLADPATGAVGAVHAGWRGTAAGAVREAVAAMIASYGCDPSRLVTAIGPSIGPCCYEVGSDVEEAYVAAGHSRDRLSRWFVRQSGARARLDLWEATGDQLRDAGVEPSRIHAARLCTAHLPQWFFSYRRDGESTGRMAAAVRARAPG